MKQSKSKLKKILITLFICFVVVEAVHETDPNYNDKSETTVATTKQTTKFVAKNIENVSTKNTKAKNKTNNSSKSKNKSSKSKSSKDKTSTNKKSITVKKTSYKNINVKSLKFKGKAYTVINNNKPYFTKKEITKKSFESYSSLDSFGRCGVAVASVGRDIMPTQKRGAIGSVRPTGWHTIKYSFVDGKYLYNRCHLIGYQLTGENANERNLITGTRYLNVDGMLPFENMVADYVKETNNHVMYRVTPIFRGSEIVARGVLMEGYSVEDSGAGIEFNVYCYNAQPGVSITYKTGDSKSTGKYANTEDNENNKKYSNNIGNKNSGTSGSKKSTSSSGKVEYVLNMNTHKFHLPSCSSVKRMSESNKGIYTGTREDVINQGYDPCKICNP